jgi:hypothetical protein
VCGLRADGEIRCRFPDTGDPPPTLPSGKFDAIAGGGGNGCGIRTGGLLACWGPASAYVTATWPVAWITVEPQASVGKTTHVRWGAAAHDRSLLFAFFDDSDPAVWGTLVIEVISSGKPVIIDGIVVR